MKYTVYTVFTKKRGPLWNRRYVLKARQTHEFSTDDWFMAIQYVKDSSVRKRQAIFAVDVSDNEVIALKTGAKYVHVEEVV